METVCFNGALAAGLFFLNGLLGRVQYGYRNLFEYERFSFGELPDGSFSGNFFLKIVNPAIYTALICAVLQRFLGLAGLCGSLWMIVPLYWLLRLAYIALKNYFLYINWRYELLAMGVSLLLGEGVFFLVLRPLLRAGETVFIPLEDLRNAVWFAIIAYVTKVVWEVVKSAFEAGAIFPPERRARIIMKKYRRFSGKYQTELLRLTEDLPDRREFLCLVYAVMIYEDYNRPPVWRLAERLAKRLLPRREMTLGIMQVRTGRDITELESVRLGTEKLLEAYLDSGCIEDAVRAYNRSGEYLREVEAIFYVLAEQPEDVTGAVG